MTTSTALKILSYLEVQINKESCFSRNNRTWRQKNIFRIFEAVVSGNWHLPLREESARERERERERESFRTRKEGQAMLRAKKGKLQRIVWEMRTKSFTRITQRTDQRGSMISREKLEASSISSSSLFTSTAKGVGSNPAKQRQQ